jgi:hypothetical protein
MSEPAPFICCICRKVATGHGHNAWPVYDGRCCDSCNYRTVLPARWNWLQAKAEKDQDTT